MTEYVLIIWLLAVMCSCVGVVAHITCKPKRKPERFVGYYDEPALMLIDDALFEYEADDPPPDVASVRAVAPTKEQAYPDTSQVDYTIAQIEKELAEIRMDIPLVKGIAHKALTIAEAGLEAELAIITASASVGGRDALEAHINELEHVLSARTTPYGRDSKGLAYSGVPGYVLDVKWGILKSYMEVEV